MSKAGAYARGIYRMNKISRMEFGFAGNAGVLACMSDSENSLTVDRGKRNGSSESRIIYRMHTMDKIQADLYPAYPVYPVRNSLRFS